MTLRYGYVSNGFVQHRLEDALAILADEGYAGVGLTLDPHHLDPFATDIASRIDALGRRLSELGLSVVIETGASFLLDPRRKHEPTLVSASGCERRIDLMERAIAIAADLGAEAVSFWSGVVHDAAESEIVWSRLLSGCERIIETAARRDVKLAFEPEPGMFIDTLDRYEELARRLDGNPVLGLTLDIGHIRCNETLSEAEVVLRSASRLRYVQIDDMRRGVHEHLDFGEGEVDFDAALGALRRIGYEGLVAVELSRHSHAAHRVIPAAIRFLEKLEQEVRP